MKGPSPTAMQTIVLLVFLFVYIGMFLGEIPPLRLDRTGIALVGAIFLVMAGVLSPEEAGAAIDIPTVSLLFGLMVISSQFRLGGFYTAVTRRLAAVPWTPQNVLLLLICVAGMLSALLANDIVCLAMTPILIEGCARRRWNPMPFLLGLACASNIGSAATLIGNPQNMLIGQRLRMSFAAYLLDSLVPTLLGLIAAWGILLWIYRSRWKDRIEVPPVESPTYNAWQSTKGWLVLTLLVGIFLFTSWPREVAALTGAGLLLMSRRLASRAMLGLVDWQILVLFIGLFVVNDAIQRSGLLEAGMWSLNEWGIDLRHPAWLFGVTVVLSNLVSNVPAVMLLLPAASHPFAGPILALSSTLAGNLILVGSIANLIVADKASEFGIQLGWREHARVGIPVTLVTLIIAAGWLALRMGWHQA